VLDDAIKNSSPFFAVTFQGLAAGTYSITTYHHDTNEDVVNDDGTINITVTDADGARLVADHLQQSWGPNPPFVGTVSFTFRSDGSGDVVLDIMQNNDGAGHQEAFLNGFEIDVSVSPACASSPSPADGATDVPREVVLGWTPGIFAPSINGHKVYISENFDDVNDGIGGIAQDANSYAPPQRLDFGTTYYWRVDEVNGPPDYAVHEGSVWSFTTEPVAYAIENITATASSRPALKRGGGYVA
jgi:hypothetical protein